MLDDLDGSSRVLEIDRSRACLLAFSCGVFPERGLLWDTFTGAIEGLLHDVDRQALETRFDKNVALVDADRVHKLAGDSRQVLVDLLPGGTAFEFIYVDGSHLGLDVLVDAARLGSC